MDDMEIHTRITALVAEEHHLRAGAASAEENARLAELERALDQCWDLLRQRRARRDAGVDPDGAAVRSEREVEGYRQ